MDSYQAFNAINLKSSQLGYQELFLGMLIFFLWPVFLMKSIIEKIEDDNSGENNG